MTGRIVETARDPFRLHGYQGTSPDLVIAAAGVEQEHRPLPLLNR